MPLPSKPTIGQNPWGSALNAFLDGVTNVVVSVAASDSSATDKAGATYVCDGTSDQIELQAAIDAVATTGAGTIMLLPGTFNLTAGISLSHPSNGTTTTPLHLDFKRGAKLAYNGVTGTTAILKVESSDCVVTDPWITGSGVKGNGYGLVLGGDTSNFGGRYTKTVYRCVINRPRLDNLRAGLVFAVDRTASSSSGDNAVFGGYISDCVDGIYSCGFTNRVYGITVAGCDYNIHASADRNSHTIEVYGATLNAWAKAAIWLESDKGSLFEGIWAEHTAAESSVPAACIILGSTTKSARSTKFRGNTDLHLFDENYLVQAVNANEVSFEQITLSTAGSLPVVSCFRQESTNTGVVRCNRFSFQTGNVPSTWNYAKLTTSNTSATGRFVLKAIPAPANSNSDTTIGDSTPAAVGCTYFVDVVGSPSAATYWAKDETGGIVAVAADTASTSGLLAVVDAILADEVHIHFGKGRYHFLDAPLGTEAWANTEVGFTVHNVYGATFSGEGMESTTLSAFTNTTTPSPDVGTFLFTNSENITLRDMTIEQTGAYMSTMETVNCNQGNGFLIERCKFNSSKSTVSTMDGGDVGKTSKYSVIRNNVYNGRPVLPEVDLVPTGGSLGNGITYTYAVAWRDKWAGYLTAATASSSGSVATITTSPAHEFAAGEQVVLQNFSVPGYNGLFTIASTPTSTTFTVPVSAGLSAASGGIVIGPGTTKPSALSTPVLTANSTSKINVYLDRGSYTTQSRVVYRYDGASWKQVAVVANNVDTVWTDTGVSGTVVSTPFTTRSTIPHSAIQLLATKGHVVDGNLIDGVGTQAIPSAAGQGIRAAQKQGVSCDYNIIVNNQVRGTSSHGIYIVGAAHNVVSSNMVSECGSVASRAQGIRVDSSGGVIGKQNLILGNQVFDNQSTATPSGGLTMSNCLNAAATSTQNVFRDNYISDWANNPVSDVGTANVFEGNYGYNPIGISTVTVTTSPFTYTAAHSTEVLYISGGSVTSITKSGSNLGLTSGAFTLSPNESIVVAYSVVPTIFKDRK